MNDRKLVDFIAEQLQGARQLFDATVEGSGDEHLHYLPAGTANPIGATIAHVITSEDMMVNMLAQDKPMILASLKDNAGMSEPIPEDWSKYAEWTRSVKIDVAKLKDYQAAVVKATDEYLASLTDADLDKEIDAQMMGKHKLGAFLASFIVGHYSMSAGEVAAIKGIQGLKGYPF